MVHEKKRILHIIPNLECTGGIQHYVLNICRGIDKSRFQCDVLHHNWRQITNAEQELLDIEFKNAGSKIYSVADPSQGILKFLKESKEIFQTIKPYDIVQIHTTGAAPRFLKLSYKYRIPNRLLHIHESKLSENFFHRLRNRILLSLSMKYATKYIAVSKFVGEKVFSNKAFETVKVGIDINSFKFCGKTRKEVRKAEQIGNDSFVVGCVGRLTKVKNCFFMLDLFKSISDYKPNSILLFIGDGKLKNDLINYAKKISVKNKVVFLGNKENINEYYSALDALVMPSHYEGFPLAALEAQISGLPVFLSDNISKEVDIVNCNFFSLNDDSQTIAKQIVDFSKNTKRSLDVSNFDGFTIEKQVDAMEKIYESL